MSDGEVLSQRRVLPLYVSQGQTERQTGIQGLTVGRSLSAGRQGPSYGDKVRGLRGWRGRPGGGRGKRGSRGRETCPWEPDCRIGFIQLRFLHKLKIEPLYCTRLRMCVCVSVCLCVRFSFSVLCEYFANVLACVCVWVCVWLFMDSLGASLGGQWGWRCLGIWFDVQVMSGSNWLTPSTKQIPLQCQDLDTPLLLIPLENCCQSIDGNRSI